MFISFCYNREKRGCFIFVMLEKRMPDECASTKLRVAANHVSFCLNTTINYKEIKFLMMAAGTVVNVLLKKCILKF